MSMKDIFNNIIQKKDFKDPKDIDLLIEICKAYPHFKLPYVLLLNYQPDFFNQEFWKKGEEYLLEAKANLKHYFDGGASLERSHANKPFAVGGSKKIDQRLLLQKFLEKGHPKFI
jgi:hypothetical protein